MRLVPTTGTVPVSVNKYLLPGERQVITVRSHPAVLMPSVGAATGGFIAAAVLTGTVSLSGEATLIMWLVWALLAVYALLKTFVWSVGYFVVTSQRMLVAKGVFTRDVAMIPNSRVENLRFSRTTTGRILGYGHFTIAPVGQDPALRKIRFMPYPEQLYLEIMGLLLPRSDNDDDE
jgi:membrane protein YdbS with pleckstrin-like domain